ncbi:hypothetical protein K458DRAFT_412471 [Lentithecium fluviatile CBS 122367]|uniref:Uncharacterized protein n=1 Tax=Lentithecium fluviatile CBS 122367 TaxID=1168545 RepID=A0A6G1JL48_9PLEO|nr:hypothetical protein K458DRAFT_412471 [Lentithecium fluviatile CBS 122367]
MRKRAVRERESKKRRVGGDALVNVAGASHADNASAPSFTSRRLTMNSNRSPNPSPPPTPTPTPSRTAKMGRQRVDLTSGESKLGCPTAHEKDAWKEVFDEMAQKSGAAATAEPSSAPLQLPDLQSRSRSFMSRVPTDHRLPSLRLLDEGDIADAEKESSRIGHCTRSSLSRYRYGTISEALGLGRNVLTQTDKEELIRRARSNHKRIAPINVREGSEMKELPKCCDAPAIVPLGGIALCGNCGGSMNLLDPSNPPGDPISDCCSVPSVQGHTGVRACGVCGQALNDSGAALFATTFSSPPLRNLASRENIASNTASAQGDCTNPLVMPPSSDGTSSPEHSHHRYFPVNFYKKARGAAGARDSSLMELDESDPSDEASAPAEFEAQFDSHAPSSPGTVFTKFMELPGEIRERVHHFVLAADKPIVPHLCDARSYDDGYIKFHDENEERHDAVHKRLNITRTSRLVRNESLPIFYSANTFKVCADLLTYFERLAHLGRFHMIRNVTFTVDFMRELMAPKALRDILQNVAEQEAYEKTIIGANMKTTRDKKWREALLNTIANANLDQACDEAVTGGHEDTDLTQASEADIDHQNDVVTDPAEDLAFSVSSTSDTFPPLEVFQPDLTRFYTNKRTVLSKHPQYIAGGLNWISTFLVLRKLASEFTSKSADTPSAEYSHKLVLHVPTAQIFTAYDTLKYFPAICEGLGIKLHFAEGREVECGRWGIRFDWRQKYQKKDFKAESDVNGGKSWDLDALSKRIKEMYPDLDKIRRPERNVYMRSNCKGTGIEWFTVHTAGGGHW